MKSRTLAARLVDAGYVKVNGQRATVRSRPVAVGDVLTLALEREVRVLEVLALGERRGPYEEARLLYRDLGERRTSCA